VNLKTVRLVGPSGETLTLGVLDDPGLGFTLERTGFDAAERAQFSSNLPLVAGGVVAPGRQSFRSLRISGLLVAPTDLEAAGLARQLVFLLRDAGTDPVSVFYTPELDELELSGFLTGAVRFEPVERGPWLRYEFELECPDPVALGDSQEDDIDETLTNAGTAPTWPTITVTLSGTVTSLRVGSNTTGDYVQLDGLTSPDEVVIVSRPGFETVEVDGVAALDTLTVASTFFPLLPGDNDLYVTVLAGGGSATAQAEWRDGFLL
jgi:hypothetical protein